MTEESNSLPSVVLENIVAGRQEPVAKLWPYAGLLRLVRGNWFFRGFGHRKNREGYYRLKILQKWTLAVCFVIYTRFVYVATAIIYGCAVILRL